jgi:hypothetical protein
MDERTLFFGSVRTGAGETFPYGNLEEGKAIEAYALIVQTCMQKLRSALQFALIELIEFEESGDRRSSSVTFSDLPDFENNAIIQKHYDIIRELKREPGMDWSTLSANVVQFGPAIFCFRQPHDKATATHVATRPEAAGARWSKPSTITLPSDYRTMEEPDEARVMAKLDAYAKRASTILPTNAGVLHVLVVPFSVLEGKGQGRKLGAACILIDAPESLQDDIMQEIYVKAQLFWLRFCACRNNVAEPANAQLYEAKTANKLRCSPTA